MKTQTKVTGITMKDLADLFDTATCGSNWLGIDYSKKDDKKEYAYASEKCAAILLEGGKIRVCDYYAEEEDEHYGNLPHRWDRDDECVRYDVTLKDIEKGIGKCIDNGGWEAKCAMNLIDEDGDVDLYEAEAIMQVIVFGELIYG